MQMPATRFDYFALTGGLNLVSPPLSLKPGTAIDALNFEVGIDGGYTRVAGYERYSGQPAPSDARYVGIPVILSGTVEAGDEIEGDSSGLTGIVIKVSEELIFVTKATAGFTVGETLLVRATPVGEVASAALLNGGAMTPAENAELFALAADAYREDIAQVPGSGPVRGVYHFMGTSYAFRDAVDGLSGKMYKSSSSGWQEVGLGYEVNFSNANTSVGEGDTLSQSGITAQIKRVVVESGTLASGTNTGKLILGTPSGAFIAGAASSTGGGSLTLAAGATAITIPPGGSYEFATYNFTGSGQTKRMYGVNGVGRMFEFDGEVFVPIKTGLPVDTPEHLATHANYLWASYKSSVLYSGIGAPYNFTAVGGAAEIAVGDFVTGFLPVVGGDGAQALAIFANNRTHIVYGSSGANFNVAMLSGEAGGRSRTMRTIGDSFVYDSLGVRKLSTTLNFGNFTQAQVTNPIRPFVLARRAQAVGACVSRHKDQYRIFFADGYVLHISLNNQKVTGNMPIKLAHVMNCIESVETDTGDEFILGGGTDGYVYRFEKGTSFDGQAISAFLNLAFAYQGGPRIKKKFRKAVYEFSGLGYAELETSYSLAYASDEIANPIAEVIESPSRPVFWDSFTWDSFFWDGRSLAPMIQKLDGSAENISLIIRCVSAEYPSFTIHSASIHYTPRRALR